MNAERLKPVTRIEARSDTGEALLVHAPTLLAAARAMTLDEAEAQDVVQTTMEIALRRSGELRSREALRAWLLTVQTREAFRIRRRLRRFVRLTPVITEVLASPSASDPTDVISIRQALRHLPPRTRAAVVLHHMVGLSVSDTAAALGVSENTVKSQLKTGLGRLREELRDA